MKIQGDPFLAMRHIIVQLVLCNFIQSCTHRFSTIFYDLKLLLPLADC